MNMTTFPCFVRGLTASAATAALLSMTGCGAIQVRSGQSVDPGQVESGLTVGKSSAADVRRVFGEPANKGREALPFGPAPRTIWSYHYEASMIDMGRSGSDSRRMFVLVFLRDDMYDGYLWFSSLLEHRRPR